MHLWLDQQLVGRHSQDNWRVRLRRGGEQRSTAHCATADLPTLPEGRPRTPSRSLNLSHVSPAAAGAYPKPVEPDDRHGWALPGSGMGRSSTRRRASSPSNASAMASPRSGRRSSVVLAARSGVPRRTARSSRARGASCVAGRCLAPPPPGAASSYAPRSPRRSCARGAPSLARPGVHRSRDQRRRCRCPLDRDLVGHVRSPSFWCARSRRFRRRPGAS